MQTPRTEFAQALKAIATERGLDPEVIIDTIKQAIIVAYKRDARDRGENVDEMDFEVEINPVNGEAKIFAWPALPEASQDESLEKAEDSSQKTSVLVEKKDVTPPGFGRIAAQTAKQVIHQKIREAEKSSVMDEYNNRVGTLISGLVLRFDGPNVKIDLGKMEAIMPAEERTPNEKLSINQRLTFLLKEIKEGLRGKEVILSRSDPNFVKRLFAREVPEIGSESVEIKSIAREAGIRTKMTVYSNQQVVDPVGSCVGQKGVRVQAVTNELGGERVDIIPWSENVAELIKASLSPAEDLEVILDEENKVAHVKAPEDQLSLAIGRDGQNARLSAKLTGWRIEVESIGEAGEKVKPKEKESKPEEKSVSTKVVADAEEVPAKPDIVLGSQKKRIKKVTKAKTKSKEKSSRDVLPASKKGVSGGKSHADKENLPAKEKS